MHASDTLRAVVVDVAAATFHLGHSKRQRAALDASGAALHLDAAFDHLRAALDRLTAWQVEQGAIVDAAVTPAGQCGRVCPGPVRAFGVRADAAGRSAAPVDAPRCAEGGRQ